MNIYDVYSTLKEDDFTRTILCIWLKWNTRIKINQRCIRNTTKHLRYVKLDGDCLPSTWLLCHRSLYGYLHFGVILFAIGYICPPVAIKGGRRPNIDTFESGGPAFQQHFQLKTCRNIFTFLIFLLMVMI